MHELGIADESIQREPIIMSVHLFSVRNVGEGVRVRAK